jgi:hypothetical protein
MTIETVNIKKSFKFYRNNYENTTIDRLLYYKIVSGYFKFLVRKLITGWYIQLSSYKSLGVLAIVFKKPQISICPITGRVKANKALIDWKTTKRWQALSPNNKGYIYHTNEHSHGMRASIVWWKTDMNVLNRNLYDYKSHRGLRKLINKQVWDGFEYLTN